MAEIRIMGSEPLLKRALKDFPPEAMPEGIRGGHTKYIWDPGNEIEVEAARKNYEFLRGKGFAAFEAGGETGEQGRQIFAFDPQAGRIIMMSAMRGG